MAGIYIPNMQMPKTCYDDCPCQGIHWYNPLNESTKPMTGKRLDNCPLIPVPVHGRLVEADAVEEQIDEWIDAVGYATIGKGLSYYGELLGCIEDAPTIIPADGKDGAE